MEVDNSREAIETILTHTSRPVDLIRRKNVTKEVLLARWVENSKRNEKLPGDLQVPARREGAGEAEGVGEQGNAHGQVDLQ